MTKIITAVDKSLGFQYTKGSPKKLGFKTNPSLKYIIPQVTPSQGIHSIYQEISTQISRDINPVTRSIISPILQSSNYKLPHEITASHNIKHTSLHGV